MISISSKNRTIIQCILSGFGAILLLTWIHIRPLGIFVLAIMFFWFYKTQCTIQIVLPPEIQNKLNYLIERFGHLRHDNPGLFCCLTSTFLGILAIIGHLLSGSTVVIIGLIIAAIISTKYNFKCIKIKRQENEESLQNAENKQKQTINNYQYADVEEFLPEENDINLFLLQRASDQSTNNSNHENNYCNRKQDGIFNVNDIDDDEDDDDKSDDIPSELLIPDLIPEIDENSSDDDDDISIDVPIEKIKLLSASMVETSTIKTDQLQQQQLKTNLLIQNQNYSDMEFKKGHFKKDSSISSTSSSSDDESLSRGLSFPEYSTVDGNNRLRYQHQYQHQQQKYYDDMNPLFSAAIKSQTKSFLANSGNIIPNLVSGIVEWSLRSGGGGAGGSRSRNNFGSGATITEITSTDTDDQISNNSNILDTSLPSSSSAAATSRILIESSDSSDFELLDAEEFN